MGFQFKDHRGIWTDYDARSDALLKEAFKAKQPTVRTRHGQYDYEVDFSAKTQVNLATGHVRSIRFPHSFKGKSEKGKGKGTSRTFCRPNDSTTMVRIPEGAFAGSEMSVPHPDGGTFIVRIPAGAVPGSVIQVDVPKQNGPNGYQDGPVIPPANNALIPPANNALIPATFQYPMDAMPSAPPPMNPSAM